MTEFIAYLFIGCVGLVFAVVIIAAADLIRKHWLIAFTVLVVLGLAVLMWWLSYSLPICAHLLGY